jgi:hypothetical protein
VCSYRGKPDMRESKSPRQDETWAEGEKIRWAPCHSYLVCRVCFRVAIMLESSEISK